MKGLCWVNREQGWWHGELWHPQIKSSLYLSLDAYREKKRSEIVFLDSEDVGLENLSSKIAFERLYSDPVLQPRSDCDSDNQYIPAIVLFIIICCLNYQHSVSASEVTSLITNASFRLPSFRFYFFSSFVFCPFRATPWFLEVPRLGV